MKTAFGKAYLEELERAKNTLMEEIEKDGRMFQVMMAKYEDIKNLHDTMVRNPCQFCINIFACLNFKLRPKLLKGWQNEKLMQISLFFGGFGHICLTEFQFSF